MAVVIRLQGLPVVAGSADIRRFFSGLNIPDGGVHIIGGEKGEAFIIFATDEDARQAMSYSGGYIKDSRVEFFLSSKTEMQNIIEISRKRLDRGRKETITGSRQTGTSGVGSLSNLVAAIKGMSKSGYDSKDSLREDFHCLSKSNYSQLKKDSVNRDGLYLFMRGLPYSATEADVVNFFSGLQVEEVIIINQNGKNTGSGVVKFATSSDAMKGLQRDKEYMGARFIDLSPATEGTWIKYGGRMAEELNCSFGIDHFDHHLDMESFSSNREHLRRESSYLSSRERTHSRSPNRRVTVHMHSRSSPRRIMSHSRSPSRQVMTHARSSSPPRRITARTRSRTPLRRTTAHARSRTPPWRAMARTRSRTPPYHVTAHMHSQSPPRRPTARTRSRTPSRRSTARTCSRSPSPQNMVLPHSRSPSQWDMAHVSSRSPQQTAVHSHSPVPDLASSYSPENDEYYVHVKNLAPAIEKRDLMQYFTEAHVLSEDITFLRPNDSEARKKDAVVKLQSKTAYYVVLGYNKRKAFGRKIYVYPISKTSVLELVGFSEMRRSPERHHRREEYSQAGYSGSKTCVYIRNFPFDVTKVEVQKFFAGFNIDDSNIYLLYDDKGVGLGEALVKFRSEDQAQKAESLNRRRFLGTEVLLRCISEEQMQEFGINVSSPSDEKIQDHLHEWERNEHFYSAGSQGQSMRGNSNHPSNYRNPSDDFMQSSDHFRGPSSFSEFGGESIPRGFPEGRFLHDYNFSDGSDRVTLIKLKNIPFQATPNEILDFFHGYKIIPESVSILRNEYGMSSGEAILAMVNYNEAVAAINELNDRPIGKRKVNLSFA
uniref:RNA binding motif protein 12B n=1 Tax=Salvator merianae TaxID=96440 RepID=A0A8D0DLR0_SALMN